MPIPVPLLPRWLRYTAVGIVTAVIFYGSLVTVPETAVDDINPSLIQPSHWRHLLAYLALAGTLAYATDHWSLPRWQHAVLVIALASGYGILMETGQAFLPHRTPFLFTDVIVNTVGASGVLAWFALRPHLDCRPLSSIFTTNTNPDQ